MTNIWSRKDFNSQAVEGSRSHFILFFFFYKYTTVQSNPASRTPAQHQISPCNINALWNRVVMRITDKITQDLLDHDLLSTSSHYFCGKWIEATKENSNSILGFKGVIHLVITDSFLCPYRSLALTFSINSARLIRTLSKVPRQCPVPGGALGFFLGGYVPRGTPKLVPRSKKNFP